MIEINLVPSVKQEFLNSQRLRAKVIAGSVLVSMAAAGLVVLLFIVLGAQALRDTSANNGIDEQFKKLTSDRDIDKIVTIQAQLGSISKLNDDKYIMSRVLNVLEAINPAAPNNVKMTSVMVNPAERTITIEGTADSGFNAGDTFKKTIMNATVKYIAEGSPEVQSIKLTDDVSSTDVGIGEDQDGKSVLSFTIAFTYPEELFSNKVTSARVETPDKRIDVTDSRLRVPESLFGAPAKAIEEGN